MSLRLIHAGSGDLRDVCVIYHLDPDAQSIQARVVAAAPDACIVNVTEEAFKQHYSRTGQGGLAVLRDVLDAAGRMAGDFVLRHVVLCGYSEGVQALRAHLHDGALADAWIAVDGTHSSSPPAMATQIEPWRKLADEARVGTTILLASHTLIQPPDYLSTRDTLRLVTGWPLSDAGPDAAPVRRQDGALVVYSYAGRDAAAHRFQGQSVLPMLLGEAMRLLGAAGHDTFRETPDAPEPGGARYVTPSILRPPANSLSSFGSAVLMIAEEDLDEGIRENGGKNHGSMIKRLYLDPLGLAPGSSYCAAAVTSWMRRASGLTGLKAPIAGSAGAKALMDQFKAAGLWKAAPLTAADLQPGDALCWDRGTPDEPWHGHVGLNCEAVGGSSYTIEANADRIVEPVSGEIYAVCQAERLLSDPTLLGRGRWK